MQRDARTVTHAFPLRSDLIVHIELPIDLTRVDAARLAAFVASLAFAASEDSSGHADELEGGTR